jgi:hypothetical protein
MGIANGYNRKITGAEISGHSGRGRHPQATRAVLLCRTARIASHDELRRGPQPRIFLTGVIDELHPLPRQRVDM